MYGAYEFSTGEFNTQLQVLEEQKIEIPIIYRKNKQKRSFEQYINFVLMKIYTRIR